MGPQDQRANNQTPSQRDVPAISTTNRQVDYASQNNQCICCSRATNVDGNQKVQAPTGQRGERTHGI